MGGKSVGENRVVISRGGKPRTNFKGCNASEKEVDTIGLILNTLRTGDADLRFYITTVQGG